MKIPPSAVATVTDRLDAAGGAQSTPPVSRSVRFSGVAAGAEDAGTEARIDAAQPTGWPPRPLRLPGSVKGRGRGRVAEAMIEVVVTVKADVRLRLWLTS